MAIESSEEGSSYEDRRPYEELSKEFQDNWPTAYRTIKLIPMMYNRLTTKEGYSHKAAINKIYNDHAHLPGFSKRNIRRNLPEDNPMVPRRIRPPWPKTSITENDSGEKFSDTGLDEQGYGSKKDSDIDSAVGSSSQDVGEEKEDHKPREGHEQLPTIPQSSNPRPPNCGEELRDKIKGVGEEQVKYPEAREQAISEEDEEGLDRESAAANDNNSSKNNYRLHHDFDFEFALKLGDVRRHVLSRFRNVGDNGDLWFSGTIDPATRSVVCAYLGRINERTTTKSKASDGQEEEGGID
jgi:hypothetical protein